MFGYWVVPLLGSCVDLRIVPGCTECQRCQWFVPFYGAKQVLWNSKVWIAALCCDVRHSLTAFGSYTFSLRNAYNILNSTVPADILWHGDWNEIESFQDWCCEIVWSKSPQVTRFILWDRLMYNYNLYSVVLISQLRSWAWIGSSGAATQFHSCQLGPCAKWANWPTHSIWSYFNGQVPIFLLIDHQITVTNIGNSSIMEWSPDNAGNQ